MASNCRSSPFHAARAQTGCGKRQDVQRGFDKGLKGRRRRTTSLLNYGFQQPDVRKTRFTYEQGGKQVEITPIIGYDPTLGWGMIGWRVTGDVEGEIMATNPEEIARQVEDLLK